VISGSEGEGSTLGLGSMCRFACPDSAHIHYVNFNVCIFIDVQKCCWWHGWRWAWPAGWRPSPWLACWPTSSWCVNWADARRRRWRHRSPWRRTLTTRDRAAPTATPSPALRRRTSQSARARRIWLVATPRTVTWQPDAHLT